MAPHINFVDNFFIVERIDLKFGVNSYLSFSDHMKFFRVGSGVGSGVGPRVGQGVGSGVGSGVKQNTKDTK